MKTTACALCHATLDELDDVLCFACGAAVAHADLAALLREVWGHVLQAPTRPIRPAIEPHRPAYTETRLRDVRAELDARPRDVRLWLKWAESSATIGHVDDALYGYRRAVDVFRSDGFLLKCVAVLKQMATLLPGDARIHLELARCYAQMGYATQARASALVSFAASWPARPSEALQIAFAHVDDDDDARAKLRAFLRR